MKKKLRLRRFMKFYLQLPVAMTLLLVCMNIWIYIRDVSMGYFVSAFVVIYFLITLLVYLVRKNSISESLVRFAVDYGQVQRKLIRELALPYAVLDSEGYILMANDEFADVIGYGKKTRQSVSVIFPDITKSILPRTEMDVELSVNIEESNYRAVLRNIKISSFSEDVYWYDKLGADRLSGGDNELIAMYLYDETEITKLKQINLDQKLIIGLLYIDNYEEALESIDEVRCSLLTALVDRKINKYMQNIDAIIRKLEKDKYFFILQNRYLAQLQNSRFSLLDDVRGINIGNEMSVTISIGMGVNADTFAQAYEYARASIDLALGRGGDQVVIRDGERIQYYGGKSLSVEKNTRVKARVKAHALREFMESKDKVVIMGHKLADVDSFGAAIGIYRIAKTLNKRAYIVVSEVTAPVRAMIHRFLNNPEYEEDMILGQAAAMDMVDNNTLLTIVDVNRPSYTECPELLKMTKTIVILDHHRQAGEPVENAVLSYIEPYASSACEMVAEILQYIGDGLKLRQPEADAMYSGVMIDTNNFLTKTGVRTFEAAAYLRRNGADVTRLRKIFRTEMPEYLTKAKAMTSTETFLEHYAFAICDSEGVESPTVLGAQVANELLNITNIKASFVFTDVNQKIYISARSIDELNVQVVMEKLGGGGHMSVAGAQLSCGIIEAMSQVKDILRGMSEKGEI